MKKVLSVLLAALLLATAIPLGAVSVSAAATGKTGDCTWTLEGTHLTISGNGKMQDYYGLGGHTWGGTPTSITIEEGVTSIGRQAFQNCTDLTSVTIPDSVTSIGDYAFQGCSNKLTSVTIPDSVISIGNYAFEGCTSLRSITIPDSVTTVGYCAFEYCWNMTSVVIGNGVTAIGAEMFSNCPALTSITIPDSVTTIGDSAFGGCTGLKTVNIPNSVVTIEKDAFSTCKSLTSITIPDSVTTIGDWAFTLCTSLESITFGSGVSAIGYGVFEHCGRLAVIDVDNNNPNYCTVDNVLYSKDMTTLIHYPGSKSDTCYIVPNSVTTIEALAFWNPIFNSLVIGTGVRTIHDSTFYGCLPDVYYRGSEKDRANIDFVTEYNSFRDATWHYNSITPKDLYSDTVTHSVMDTDRGSGLAFRFELSAQGVIIGSGNVVDLTNATVNYLGTDCKLVGMGAVLTNDANIGNSDFTREQSTGQTIIDIPAIYLQEATDTSCAFATRLINIPDSQLERTIYARPYFVVEHQGEEIVVYGDVDAASCAEYM